MTARIHRHCIRTAGRISPALKSALARAGRVSLPDPGRRRLAHFLARAVTGQQLSTAAARSIWARVEVAVKANGGSVPEFFCAQNVGVLRQCGLSQAKVRALLALREAEADGLLSVRRLRRLSHAARSAHLQQIWGIGQWTADMASIFYFGDPDVWPEGDVGVYRGLEIALGKRSKRTVLKIANAFAPYRSFLALYMWKVLDAPKQPRSKAVFKQPA